MTTKSQSAAKGCVCLRLTHPAAQQVCVAGSFNDWHPTVTPMIRLDDGQWAKDLALPPGRYEYRFVVDGEWADDPAATELIPNTFGTANAVLVVAEVNVSGAPALTKPAKSRAPTKAVTRSSPPRSAGRSME